MDTHRPGPLKQRNKVHKSSKRRASKKDGGRIRTVSSSSLRSISSKGGSTISKITRKNQLSQLRSLKREEILNARRGIEIAPILVAVLNFGDDYLERNAELLKKIENCSKDYKVSEFGQHVHFVSFRSNFEMIFLDHRDLHSALDLTKIADILLVLHPSGSEEYFDKDGTILDPKKFNVLDAVYNHSLPQTVHAMVGFEDSRQAGSKKSGFEQFKKSLTAMINKNYPGTLESGKLRTLDSSSDLTQFFHYCSNIKRKSNSYSSRRSQLLAENAEFVPSVDNPEIGSLLVEGFVRNTSFNVNSLVYIPEFGEFQLDVVQGVANPFRTSKQNPFFTSPSETFCEKADPEKRPSLDDRVHPEQTIFEQDMEDLEELDDIAIEQAHKKIRRKVPKGTSDYQSSWIVENDDDQPLDDDDDDDDDDNDDDDEEMEDETSEAAKEFKKKQVRFAPTENSSDEFDDDDNNVPAADDNADVEMDVDDTENGNYDDEMDPEEEASQLAKFREQNEYQMFPDEIDTPADVPARERFRKFKGLKSFRTSHWDPKENLPPNYSRISIFPNFNRTKRRLFKCEPIGADPGYYVRVQVANVPNTLLDYYRSHNRPLILFQLLAHEHCISVMNIVLKKVPTYTSAVKSKEELTFVVGCRRFTTRPIFSAHTTGDKHKYEKFLRDDVACVATVYAPISFPPASVLVFKTLPTGREQLVATGSLLDCNPDRLIIKRLILSGHPFKINRKHAVVRYMFFNREDILWFRPIELRTKYGRRGHIQEPLGTHGHMKCIFDHQLCSQDTVMLCLYKRVFPKWTLNF